MYPNLTKEKLERGECTYVTGVDLPISGGREMTF